MSEPYPGAPQPRRITRLARKPIKLASSAIRPLRSSSSSAGAGTGWNAPSSLAAAGMGGGGSLNASTGGGSLDASSSSSSLNPLKRITSRNRASGAGGGGSAGEHELDGTAIVKSVRGPRKPSDGEEPAATIRVRVVKAEGLVSRDRNGLSDP